MHWLDITDVLPLGQGFIRRFVIQAIMSTMFTMGFILVIYVFGVPGFDTSGLGYEVPSLQRKLVDNQYANASDLDSVTLWAWAGQTIMIEYEASIERGELFAQVDGPATWVDKMPFVEHEERTMGVLSRTDIKESSTDRVNVQVGATGFYELYLVTDGLTGDLNLTLTVH